MFTNNKDNQMTVLNESYKIINKQSNKSKKKYSGDKYKICWN